MKKPSEFKIARAKRKVERDARIAHRRRWVPFLQAICKKYGIKLKDIPGGLQLRYHEYILSWWFSSNRIAVQYPGSGETVKFKGTSKQNEPKIFTALRKLIKVTGGEELSQMNGQRSTSE